MVGGAQRGMVGYGGWWAVPTLREWAVPTLREA